MTESTNGNGTPQPDTYSLLPDEVHIQLWGRITARLERGDALITTEDYQSALEIEYQAVTGTDVSPTLSDLFRTAIVDFNKEHPGRYVARGVMNGVLRAFQTGVHKLDWDVIKIEASGENTIDRFKSYDRVRGFLDDVRVTPDMIDARSCVKHAVDVVSGQKPPFEKRPLTDPLEPSAAPAAPVSEDAQEALKDGTISEGQVSGRVASQDRARAEIERKELDKAATRVNSYVQQGLITEEEGSKIRELRTIDDRVASGEIDAAEGDRLRNSVLDYQARDKIEHKLKGVVDHAVRFLEAFESMKQISEGCHEALRFLISRKNILVESKQAEEMDLATEELVADTELLSEVVEIMDRKDQEIRMISVCLPPYSHIAQRAGGQIGNLVIEEEFVDQLRELDADEMSDRLNSEDPEVRVRPAADMKCLIAIINYLIKPTPWRKQMRLLKIQQTIEEFYRSTDNLEEARKQAETFLSRRLRRTFKDLTADERSTMEERGAGIIDAVERKIAAERQAAVEEQTASEATAAGDGDGGAEGEEAEHDDDLSEDERARGAQIGRVEVRVAGQMKRIPYKLIADPDDPSLVVIAQRDRDTGELEPARRRGAKRLVEKGRDGIWRPTSG